MGLRLWRCYAANCLPHDIYSEAKAARLSGLTAKSVNGLAVSEEPPESTDA